MRRVFIIGVVLVVAVGGYFFFQNSRTDQSAADTDSNLQSMAVTTGDVTVTVRATGRVDPNQHASLGFSGAGVVEEILIEEGQSVPEGEILARLDGELQRIGVEQAEWGVEIAELSLTKLEQPPSERDIAAAQAAINGAWVAFIELRDNAVKPEEVRAAELQYQQALEQMDFAEKIAAEAGRDDVSTAQVGQAGFMAELSRIQLDQLREGPRQEALNAAQGQVAQAQGQLRILEAGAPELQLEQGALAIAQANLSLERAQEMFADTLLVAPFEGVVNRIYIQEGGLFAPGMAALDLVDLSRLLVIIEVDEVDIAQVEPGQTAIVDFDALNDQVFTGKVSRVADVSNQTAGVVVFEVEIDLDETAAMIRPGMTAAATIIVEEVVDVLVVPNFYIRLDRSTDEAFVNVLLDDGSLEERLIELGVQGESESEVLAGLAAGDVIAIDLSSSGFSFFEG